MGYTSNFIYEHLFLLDVKEPEKSLAPKCIQEPELVFKGYGATHYYKSLNSAELIANTIDVNGTPKITGISAGVKGNYHCFLRAEEECVTPDKDIERVLFCEAIDQRNGRPFPVSLVNSDVLPGFETGTTIFGQVIGYATDIKLAPSPTKLFETYSESARLAMFNCEGNILTKVGQGGGLSCGIWGKILYTGVDPVDYIIPLDGQKKLQHPGIPYFIINSTIGLLKIVVQMRDFISDDKFRNNLTAEEQYVFCSFGLALDVAVGEYQHNAIFDESHLVRLFANVLNTGHFWRLGPCCSKDVISHGKETTNGIEATIERFNQIYQKQKEEKLELYCKIEKVTSIKEKNCKLRIGQLGVLLARSRGKGSIGHVFLDFDESMKIKEINFFYDDYQFTTEVIEYDDILSFGIRASRLQQNNARSKEQIIELLYLLSNGELEDGTELYESLEDDAEFLRSKQSYTGKDNVYLMLRKCVDSIGSTRQVIRRLEDGILIEDSNTQINIVFSKDIKIKQIIFSD